MLSFCDSFLIVVFAQGFVKVALDCLDGRFLLMILSIPCFSWFQMFSIFFCKSCLCLRMLELKVLVSIFMLTMSTFFHKYIVLLIGFCRVHNILLSVITISWSDRPGSGLHLLTNDGLLVINRSRVLFFLVGKFTICSNKQSLNVSRKLLFSFLVWFELVMLPLGHDMSLRLKSPPIQTVAR